MNENGLKDLQAAALDACITPVFVFTCDLEVVYANPAALGLYGFEADEMTGVTGFDLTQEKVVAQQALEDLLASGKWQGELVARTKDGRSLHVVAAGRLARMGDETYVVASVLDTTELRHTRAALESERERHDSVLAHLDSVVYRNWCRTEHCPSHDSFLSQPIERLVGHAPAELLERRELWFELVHPDDRERLGEAIYRASRGEPGVLQYRVRRGPGSAYRWVEDHLQPEVGPDGDAVGLFGTLRDVTERRQVEQERSLLEMQLAQVSREWEMTFDALQDPVLILSAQGQILRLNRASLSALGVSAFEHALGREPWLCSSDALWEAVRELLGEVHDAAGGEGSSRKVVQGDESWLAAVAPLPRRSPHGPISGRVAMGSVVYLRNLTELDRLETSLRQAERMAELGALVAGVAHEVRNPLFGISAIVDALSTEAIPPEELPGGIALLRHEVERLSRLAEGLLEYGKPVPTPDRRHSLQEVVQEAIVACRAAAVKGRVVFLFRGLAELPPVIMDRSRITSALRNLVENAIQHSPEESEIRIEGRWLDDGWVEVGIHDRGEGFPEEDRERLLQPFFSRRPGGTGLGLSIAANVVRQHGGMLILDSGADGGAVVRLRLPGGRPAPVAPETRLQAPDVN